MEAPPLVALRPFLEEQAATYLGWVNDPSLAPLLGRARPVTPLEHRRWYEGAVSRSDAAFFSVWTLGCEERYVGNVWLWGIHPVHRAAELRILLGETQGRGVGTEACRQLLRFAFERLNLNKVFLYVLDSNPRARRAFEKAGFEEEGRLRQEFFVEGRYQDVLRMAAFAPAAG